ncbi:MAG TPA: phage BR0599 family protein [Arenicellales bacterium]|nr:phage BR0599 family protein [Arenicellales bacterium]
MSRPAELYRFTQGEQVWTYTSADAAIEHNGETYEPAALGRSALEQTAEINRANISITLPRTNPVAALFLADSPEAITALTVLRQEQDSTLTLWKGRAASAQASASEVSIEFESIFTSLRRPGLRARYQRACRHTLYGRGCNVDKTAFAVPGRLADLSEATATVPVAAEYDDGTFYGGMLETDSGVLRFILAHEGEQLTLARPIAELAEAFAASGYGRSYGMYYGGVAVTLYPGCDRSRATCDTRFDNIENFGGFPWIPGRNPFDGNSIV